MYMEKRLIVDTGAIHFTLINLLSLLTSIVWNSFAIFVICF